MLEKGHIPERTCCGCRKRRPKAEMLAVVRLKDGTVAIAKDENIYGRSAYLCRNKLCIEKARGKKGRNMLSINLKTNVPSAVWDEIAKLIP